jgi:hypothetical protein
MLQNARREQTTLVRDNPPFSFSSLLLARSRQPFRSPLICLCRRLAFDFERFTAPPCRLAFVSSPLSRPPSLPLCSCPALGFVSDDSRTSDNNMDLSICVSTHLTLTSTNFSQPPRNSTRPNELTARRHEASRLKHILIRFLFHSHSCPSVYTPFTWLFRPLFVDRRWAEYRSRA